jgi:hypothetical protein
MIPVNLTLTESRLLELVSAPFSVCGFENRGRSTCVDGRPRLVMTQSQVMEHLAKTIGLGKKHAKLAPR